MKQDIYSYLKYILKNSVLKLINNGILNCNSEDVVINVEPIKDKSKGDFSSNIAMINAKLFNMKPFDACNHIISEIKNIDCFCKVEKAGAGFINFFMKDSFLVNFLHDSISDDFGKNDIGKGKFVNVEYVSANPTGPLHAGHARGAVIGDVMANLFKVNGYNVTKEYYVNDHGNQIKILVNSLYERYLEALHVKVFELKEGNYPGEYLKDIAEKLVEQYSDDLLHKTEDDWFKILKNFAVDSILSMIKDDMKALGIQHDVFTSETKLVDDKKVCETIEFLRKKGLVYQGTLVPPKGKVVDDWEPKEQTLLKTEQYGDDTDRVLIKSNGDLTYFASDIAYHFDKVKRGYDIIVDCFGADHGGYVKRMEAAVDAISDRKVKFKIFLCQIVKFLDGGEEVKMSKRAGNFITLRDIINAVGSDIIRFIMLTRKSEAPMTFDFKQVVEQSKDNPVFYVQYAHARICSVLRQFKKVFPENDFIEKMDGINLENVCNSQEEREIIKTILDWPRQVKIACSNFEPHKIPFFLYEISSMFHNLWNIGKNNENLRFILENNIEVTKSKLWLLNCIKFVISNGLEILGIKAVEEL